MLKINDLDQVFSIAVVTKENDVHSHAYAVEQQSKSSIFECQIFTCYTITQVEHA
jgi:hypothetical protein